MMRHRIGWGVLLVLSLPVAGCSGGDPRHALAEQSVEMLAEMVAALETVRDPASAEAAKPRLRDLIGRLGEIHRRDRELGPTPPAEAKQLEEKYGAKVRELSGQIRGQFQRIEQASPEASAALADVTKQFRQAE